jgi:hypothetical protein
LEAGALLDAAVQLFQSALARLGLEAAYLDFRDSAAVAKVRCKDRRT